MIQEGDIRDVIAIGKLVRRNNGPEEVEKILQVLARMVHLLIHHLVPRYHLYHRDYHAYSKSDDRLIYLQPIWE